LRWAAAIMDSLSEKELRVQGSGFRKRRKKKAM
jgi:hypothetical protein